MVSNQPENQPEIGANAEVTQSAEVIQVREAIQMALMLLKQHKPEDRSERDRLWAIARTDLEKLLAFWFYLEKR